MRFTVLTLFPEQVRNFVEASITGRALARDIFALDTVQIRDFCDNAYNKVDDTLYGGGTGMLMMCEPVYQAWNSVISQAKERPHTVFLSPQGAVFTQKKAQELLEYRHLVFLCGHYEGIDRRVLDEIVDEEISIGDYVLTGGEIAACTVIDAVARMIPGVLPSSSAYEEESHMGAGLEAPQYTHPETWHEKRVPSVLTSGHHANIREWKRLKSIEETWRKRPDLLTDLEVSESDWITLLKWRAADESRNESEMEYGD